MKLTVHYESKNKYINYVRYPTDRQGDMKYMFQYKTRNLTVINHEKYVNVIGTKLKHEFQLFLYT